MTPPVGSVAVMRLIRGGTVRAEVLEVLDKRGRPWVRWRNAAGGIPFGRCTLASWNRRTR